MKATEINECLKGKLLQQGNELNIEKFLFDSRKTVSYTHLRAHETVLDIVCRLLLEKKKYYKDNAIQHNKN